MKIDRKIEVAKRTSQNREKSVENAPKCSMIDIGARVPGDRGPRAAANYQRNRLIDKNNVGADYLTRRWAVGPANFP